MPSKEHISDYSDGPNVHLAIVGFRPAELGGHVQRTAKRERIRLVFAVVRSEAKISKLDDDLPIFSLFTEKVLRLEVAVHDILQVHVVEG